MLSLRAALDALFAIFKKLDPEVLAGFASSLGIERTLVTLANPEIVGEELEKAAREFVDGLRARSDVWPKLRQAQAEEAFWDVCAALGFGPNRNKGAAPAGSADAVARAEAAAQRAESAANSASSSASSASSSASSAASAATLASGSASEAANHAVAAATSASTVKPSGS